MKEQRDRQNRGEKKGKGVHEGTLREPALVKTEQKSDWRKKGGGRKRCEGTENVCENAETKASIRTGGEG